MKLLRQESDYKYGYFIYEISMCDENNTEGIQC